MLFCVDFFKFVGTIHMKLVNQLHFNLPNGFVDFLFYGWLNIFCFDVEFSQERRCFDWMLHGFTDLRYHLLLYLSNIILA
jgi:hypothetical protein